MKFRPGGSWNVKLISGPLESSHFFPKISYNTLQHPISLPLKVQDYGLYELVSQTLRFLVHQIQGFVQKNSFWTKWRCVSITYQPVLGWWSLWNPKWSKKACSAAKIVHLVDSILISLCFLESISVSRWGYDLCCEGRTSSAPVQAG